MGRRKLATRLSRVRAVRLRDSRGGDPRPLDLRRPRDVLPRRARGTWPAPPHDHLSGQRPAAPGPEPARTDRRHQSRDTRRTLPAPYHRRPCATPAPQPRTRLLPPADPLPRRPAPANPPHPARLLPTHGTLNTRKPSPLTRSTAAFLHFLGEHGGPA